MKEINKIKIKTHSKIERYEEGVTKEQIQKGLVKPIETITTEDFIYLNKEEITKLGLIPNKIEEE